MSGKFKFLCIFRGWSWTACSRLSKVTLISSCLSFWDWSLPSVLKPLQLIYKQQSSRNSVQVQVTTPLVWLWWSLQFSKYSHKSWFGLNSNKMGLEQAERPSPLGLNGAALTRILHHLKGMAPVTQVTDSSAIPQAVRTDPLSIHIKAG